MSTETCKNGTIASDDAYNGWKNRETWAAALHYSNDDGLYRCALEAAKDGAGPALEAHFYSILDDIMDYPQDYPCDNPCVMMIREVGSEWRVDWDAVAESFAPEEDNGE